MADFEYKNTEDFRWENNVDWKWGVFVLENIITFDLFIDQEKRLDLFIEQEKNFDLEF